MQEVVLGVQIDQKDVKPRAEHDILPRWLAVGGGASSHPNSEVGRD
jgi:hypothetical protein